jgi:hypothetical protein
MKLDRLGIIRCFAMALVNFQSITLAHAPAVCAELTTRDVAIISQDDVSDASDGR